MKRRKTIAAGLLLTATMTVSLLSGCGKTDGTKEALKVNDEIVNLGTANFMLRYEQASAFHMMSSYGLFSGNALWDKKLSGTSSSSTSSGASASSNSVSSASSSAEVKSDSSADTSKTKTKASTYGEDYKNTIQNKIIERMLLRQHASEYNGSISEDLQKKIDDAAKKTYEANQKTLKKLGTTQEDVVNALQLMSYETLMRSAMTASADTNVSDEEAAQKTVTYARFSFTDADKDQKKANAENVLNQLKQNAKPAEADIKSIAKAVDSKVISTSYSYGADDTVLSDTIKKAVDTLKDGEVYPEVIEDGNYFNVIRLDQAFDRKATDSKKQTIVTQRQTKLYKDTIAAWKKDAKIEITSAWKKLKVTDAAPYKTTADDPNKKTTQRTSAGGSVNASSTSSSSQTPAESK